MTRMGRSSPACTHIGHFEPDRWRLHSAAGIMRGDWNLWDLQNASYGYLLFTPRQAKAIREEAGRRARQSEENRGSLTKAREETL